VLAPFSSATTPGSKTAANGTNYTYHLTSGNYMINGDVTLNNPDKIYVGGNAILYVTGNFSMSGKSVIYIDSGAKLKLFVGGANADFTYINTEGNANTFQYYGLRSNTSLTWSGNANYVGTVYAPRAMFTLGGGGLETMDYQGACVVNAVKLNGKFNFHYDENLKRAEQIRGYLAISWKEI